MFRLFYKKAPLSVASVYLQTDLIESIAPGTRDDETILTMVSGDQHTVTGSWFRVADELRDLQKSQSVFDTVFGK